MATHDLKYHLWFRYVAAEFLQIFRSSPSSLCFIKHYQTVCGRQAVSVAVPNKAVYFTNSGSNWTSSTLLSGAGAPL